LVYRALVYRAMAYRAIGFEETQIVILFIFRNRKIWIIFLILKDSLKISLGRLQ
jgi:hypothetical protein